MLQANAQAPAVTAGLDVGDRSSRYCVLDAAGERIEEGRVPTTEGALRRTFAGRERMRIALEVGTHSPWVSRVLAECGHEVIVANARKLRLVDENDRKTDRTDAEYLARLARLDPKLLAPVRHRGATAQADLALLRTRAALVDARTDLINHVRGAVKAVGGRVPRCSTACFAAKAEEHIPEALQAALLPVLATIASLSDQIEEQERWIEELAAVEYPETDLLRQVPGVGLLTALCYVLTLEDPTRFRKSRQVGPYLGLVPRKRDSGSSKPQLRTTKAGDPMLRRLLVQAAHYILGPFGPETDLRLWGLELAERGGKNAKKRAIVAVARKLAVLLHSLWVTGEVYEPLRHHPERAATAA